MQLLNSIDQNSALVRGWVVKQAKYEIFEFWVLTFFSSFCKIDTLQLQMGV